jgi:molybdopterin-guanine dinucleotide biosynthesis protein A
MNKYVNKCSAAILAGGENRRMPVLKAFIEVGGKKIIDRNLHALQSIFSENFIVTNQPELYSYLEVPLFGDAYDMRGPMTGIFTALLNSSSSWVFISACDMPFLNIRLIQHMSTLRKDCDAVVPVCNDKKEPLHAYYSKRLLNFMEKSLLAGEKSLKDFLGSKRVNYISSRETKKIGPVARSFVNLNTPEDIDLYLDPEDKLNSE